MSFTRWNEWVETPEGRKLFPSPASLAWYMRMHREALIRDGVMFKLRNVWQIDGEKLANWVVEESRQRTAAQYLGVA